MKIMKFNEEVKIEDMSKETLLSNKKQLMYRLGEYRTYILSNINFNDESNSLEYKDFRNIDIKTIIRELVNEFSEDFIKEINIEAFLIKINQLLDLGKKNTKKKIREAFDSYYESIDDRISMFRNNPDSEYFDQIDKERSIIPRRQYESEKYNIQVELLKLQEWVIKNKKRVAIVFEGRDASGKGSTIKRFIEYLNPKGFKVIALGVPTEEESINWLGRYEKYLPSPGEIVFFDRSWYNRAVVEPAMGYCTEEQYTNFMNSVNKWEENLIDNGLILIKFWFSITKEKQLRRFELRKTNPLKYWKFSPNDAKVLDKWDIISKFKNQMFSKTSTEISPWVIINSADKRIGRLNAMRYVISFIEYDNKVPELGNYYPEVVNVLV